MGKEAPRYLTSATSGPGVESRPFQIGPLSGVIVTPSLSASKVSSAANKDQKINEAVVIRKPGKACFGGGSRRFVTATPLLCIIYICTTTASGRAGSHLGSMWGPRWRLRWRCCLSHWSRLGCCCWRLGAGGAGLGSTPTTAAGARCRGGGGGLLLGRLRLGLGWLAVRLGG